MLLFHPLDALDALAPDISPVLVAPEAFARVRGAAALLPEAALWGSLECRLSEADGRVDFSICVPADEGGREALAEHREAILASTSESNRAGWERALDLCDDWRDPASVLHWNVPFVWIELDLDGRHAGAPPPLLIVFMQPRAGDAARASSPPEVCRAVVERALLRLAARVGAAVEARALACIDALPPGGRLLYAAPLTSRDVAAIRLVPEMQKRLVPEYLRRIGWPGAMSQVEEALALHGSSEITWIDIDVAETVLPPLGFPIYFPAGDPRWPELLDRLVERGLCTPHKRDAVLAWPGHRLSALPGRRFPLQLARSLAAKVVLRSGEPLAAKVYLEIFCLLALF